MNKISPEIDIDCEVAFKMFERYYPKKRNYTQAEVKEAIEKKLQNKFADIK